MLSVAETLTSIHGLVRWASVAAASWMLALTIVSLIRRRALGSLDRRSLAVLTGVLHAQVGLGAIIAAILFAAGAPPFEGRGGTLFGHALGGVLMAAAAALAIVVSRRGRTPLAQSAWTAGLVGLTWLLLGKWAISVPLTGAGLLIALWLERRRAPLTAPDTARS